MQCLTAVLAFTLAVKFGLRAILATHSSILVKVALAIVFVGTGALVVISAIVWARRNISARPPRRWAVIIAMVWASLQLLSYLFVPFQSPSATPAEQVSNAFQQYKSALLHRDGEGAWNLLDSHTANFYSRIVQDAASLPRRDFERLDPMHKLMVLRLRLEFRKPELQNLTGRDIFLVAVTNGWMSRSSVERVERFHSVGIKDQYATAYLPEAPRTPAFHFIKEGGEWKLSLWKSFEAINAELRRIKHQSRLSERDFWMDFLSRISKYEITEQIFQGPLE